MRIVIIFLIIFLNGCDSPIDEVGIYTVDMEYACECTNYKIFKINTPDAHGVFSEPIITAETTTEIDKAYHTVFPEDDKFLLSVKNSLVGVEVSLVFPNKNMAKEFEEKQPYYNKCYVYYFNGGFGNDKLRLDANGEQINKFIVTSYRFILKSPDCIKKIYKG